MDNVNRDNEVTHLDSGELTQYHRKLVKQLNRYIEEHSEKYVEKIECIKLALLQGKIMLEKSEDEFYRYEDLAGDIFNPEINTSIEPKVLQRQERNFKERIRRQKVWGAITHYWTGRSWESFVGIDDNSIFGFVGNDLIGSGYEIQLLEAALDAYNKQELDDEGFVIDPYRRKAA